MQKKAGILLNAKDVKTFNQAKELRTFLKSKNIEVSSLGYVENEDVVEKYSYQIGMNHFTKKGLNWFNMPKCDTVQQFIAKDFDILIDISMLDIYQLQYIVALSRARFKVGKFKEKDSYYDFMIDIKNNNIPEFIKQIKHYLELINKNTT